jgi:hypothetical protein
MTPTNRSRSSLALVAVMLVVCGPDAARAQALQAGTGMTVEAFGFATPTAVGMNAVALATVPFAIRYRGPVIVELGGAYAVGMLVDTDGDDSSIAGLTDTSIRLAVPLAGERFTISATAFLPTGKATQTQDEAAVAGVIAADLLPFRITNWGAGGGLDVSASVAIPAGPFGLGARIGYSAAREFEPLEGPEVFSYQPGNQMYARLAIDRTIGAASKVSVSATVQRFNEDAFDGVNLYRSGDRLEVLSSLNLGAGRNSSALLYAGVLHRSESAYLDGSRDFAAQDLIVAGAGLRLAGGRVAVVPATDVRVFRSADGVGQGYALGLGSSFEIPVGRAVVVPTVRGRFGNIVVNDQARSAFYGAETGLAVRFGGAR